MCYRGGVQGSNKLFGGTYYGDIKRHRDLKIDEVIEAIKKFNPDKERVIYYLCVLTRGVLMIWKHFIG